MLISNKHDYNYYLLVFTQSTILWWLNKQDVVEANLCIASMKVDLVYQHYMLAQLS